jgi:hypothetical protein
MKQDHCMELRRWRLIRGRKAEYEHIFGEQAEVQEPKS